MVSLVIRNLIGVFIVFNVFVLMGCSTTPKQKAFTLKPEKVPTSEVYCFDAVGHKKGSKPFVMGGTCCCTPTQELMDQFHADGLLMDMQLSDLIKLYEERNIRLASKKHQGCNNLCLKGPHVVKGGFCMVSPTPGTKNFEEVRYHHRFVTQQIKK